MHGFSLSDYRDTHWDAVSRVYAEGIATGHATFETDLPSEAAWRAKFLDGLCRVALDAGGTPQAWAGAVATSDRCAYAGVAEVSVYVAEAARGQGLGRWLLSDLIERSEAAGIWTLQAGIFPENTGSIALHLGCGFRLVGRRERLGTLAGVWRDVNQYERRSTVVGCAI
ncbi:MAG: N-acetyltransferase family protein [Pseudomonadota bacterium]